MKENKPLITVASFSVAGVIPHLTLEDKSYGYNKPVVSYDGQLYPSNLRGDKKHFHQWGKDRGILAVGILDIAGEVRIASDYFGRFANWVRDGLTEKEAHSFGYELGSLFETGVSGYQIVEDYNILDGLTGIRKPSDFELALINEVKTENPRFSFKTLGAEDRIVPFKITNLGTINKGIIDGQTRADSRKRRKLVAI